MFLCFSSLLLLGYVFKIFSINSLDLISQTGKSVRMGILISSAIFLVVALYSLISFIIEERTKLFFAFLAGLVGYIIGFSIGTAIPKQLEVAVISSLFISLGLLKMVTYIRAEYLNSIKIRLAVIIPKNAHSFLVILGIILSLNFYFFFSAAAKTANFKISENLLNKIMGPATAIVEKNLETQINSQLEGKLTQTIGTQSREDMLKFIQSELEETFNEGTTRQKFGLNQNAINPKDITLTPSGTIDISPMLENLKPDIVKQVNKAFEPYEKYLPILFAFSLFFILESIFSFFPFLVVPFISLILFLLKKLKFIKLIKSAAEVERFVL
ncbi:hypothetical protein AUJ94_02910 [bacterium CG2_30_40_12]|nr:MAG: hypothetical protein AUJ94_02910 [bacterium CG2_30_40_12]